MRSYFRHNVPMTDHTAEPRHTICFETRDGIVTLQQRGKDNFAVRYGLQVDAELTYNQACSKLGQAILHSLACDSLIDNRERSER